MGGMGGGGFFAVPPETVPAGMQVPASASEQPATVATVAPARAVAPSAKSATQAEVPHVEPIHLEIAPGADVNQAWDKFFAEHDSRRRKGEDARAYELRRVHQQQAVLETVQALKDAAAAADKHLKPDETAKKNAEIIALIEAALRHDQAQPWMYECLATAMKVAGRPPAEIERTIMSAAEFTQNSTDLMYLGAYLVQSGMERQALQIFHQVAQIEPFWPEPLVDGMALARKLQDLPGLEWSTTGIIGQAWLPAQAKIWDDARRVAQAKLQSLRDNKRNEEADRFEAAINQALVRDCIVRVQWTGDADIDVMVKEPGGTICSLRNPRTTGGGLLVGDLTSPDGKENIAGHVAVYSCPTAYSGEYQVLVRRIFGSVPSGNVRVIVDQHVSTPQAKETTWEKIPIKDGESVVKFDLSDGRRKESVREAQIINAAVAAVGIGQQQAILAQQLAALNDPQQGEALAGAQQSASSAAAAEAQPINPLAFWPNSLHGAVGYMPVIITLPEGTNFIASGVVSADRRYVRITCMPIFSAISQVHTFSIATGATTTTSGIGTNGQGYSGSTGLTGNGANGGGGLGGGGIGGGGGGGIF